jgi:hypothetical protein
MSSGGACCGDGVVGALEVAKRLVSVSGWKKGERKEKGESDLKAVSHGYMAGSQIDE